jgi:hypothetical protein
MAKMQEILDREKTLDEAMIDYMESESARKTGEIEQLKALLDKAVAEIQRLRSQLSFYVAKNQAEAKDCPF